MNNLKVIIVKEMLNKWEDTEIRWRGNVLTGHQRLGDSEIRDGEVLDIGTEEVEDTNEEGKVQETLESRKDITMWALDWWGLKKF